MLKPRILSLGFAVPKYSGTQEEAFSYFGYKSGLTKKIFRETGIDRRYSYVDPKRLSDISWQELCDEYAKGVIETSLEAVHNAQDNFDLQNISHISFVSVTGYTCPAPSYAIASGLGLKKSVIHSNILGQGCQAALPGLERAYDHVKSHPDHLALAISCELCSCTYFPAGERDLENVVSNAIFGDGSSAAIVGMSEDTKYPIIVDFESQFDSRYIHLLGYKWEDGRMKVVLNRRVPEIIPPLLRQAVDDLLERNSLSRTDISCWLLHPGGKTVLENLEKELGLTKERTYWSWEVMRRYGNMSSATIGVIAKHIQQFEKPQGYGLAATMGAGGAVNCLLVKWGA